MAGNHLEWWGMTVLLLLCLSACNAYDADLIGVEPWQGACWCDDGEDTFQINVNENGR